MLWQGILTGCCVLGDPDRWRFQQPLAAGENDTRQVSSSLVPAHPVPQMQQESDHAGTGDVGAEEACKEPQRWCCSQEQRLTLCWGQAERLGGPSALGTNW